LVNQILANLLGETIRQSSNVNFPGKSSRLIPLWMSLRDTNSRKVRLLPGGGQVVCDLAIPYECMVWLKQEEQGDLEVLQHLLKPGDAFVDCGANIGIWSLVAAAAVGQLGSVFAFEPNPTTADKLFSNVRLSGFTNVSITHAALGSAPGNGYLQTERAHNVSRIVDKSTSETISVPVVTLDAVLGDKRIAGCKIDVEGFELPVLSGAENLLRRHKPWLCVEFNTILANVKILDNWDVHQLLRHLGYVPRLFKDALHSSKATFLPSSFETSGYVNLYYAAS